MLVVRIEIDKSKENYQAVMEALAAFDIASAGWENGQDKAKPPRSGHTDPSDLSTGLSEAINYLKNQNDGRN
jgi:hypothetical protein